MQLDDILGWQFWAIDCYCTWMTWSCSHHPNWNFVAEVRKCWSMVDWPRHQFVPLFEQSSQNINIHSLDSRRFLDSAYRRPGAPPRAPRGPDASFLTVISSTTPCIITTWKNPSLFGEYLGNLKRKLMVINLVAHWNVLHIRVRQKNLNDNINCENLCSVTNTKLCNLYKAHKLSFSVLNIFAADSVYFHFLQLLFVTLL